MYNRSRQGRNDIPQSYGFGGHEQLEEQNNAAEDELRDKVGLLKTLAINIGDEVKEHNRMLHDTDSIFDNAGALLSNTIGNVGKLLKSGGRYHMLYLFLFVLFVVFILWMYI